jgi:hypothetical protein
MITWDDIKGNYSTNMEYRSVYYSIIILQKKFKRKLISVISQQKVDLKFEEEYNYTLVIKRYSYIKLYERRGRQNG